MNDESQKDGVTGVQKHHGSLNVLEGVTLSSRGGLKLGHPPGFMAPAEIACLVCQLDPA